MAPHSSTLAWKIPWTEEPGRAAVHGVAKSRTRLSDFTFTLHFHALEKEMATHSSVLALRIPGIGETGGLPSMGSHRVGHDWNDLATYVTKMNSTWFKFFDLATINFILFFNYFLNFFIIIFLLHNIVLVLPYINLHLPRV